jgi:hypothetical protein
MFQMRVSTISRALLNRLGKFAPSRRMLGFAAAEREIFRQLSTQQFSHSVIGRSALNPGDPTTSEINIGINSGTDGLLDLSNERILISIEEISKLEYSQIHENLLRLKISRSENELHLEALAARLNQLAEQGRLIVSDSDSRISPIAAISAWHYQSKGARSFLSAMANAMLLKSDFHCSSDEISSALRGLKNVDVDAPELVSVISELSKRLEPVRTDFTLKQISDSLEILRYLKKPEVRQLVSILTKMVPLCTNPDKAIPLGLINVGYTIGSRSPEIRELVGAMAIYINNQPRLYGVNDLSAIFGGLRSIDFSRPNCDQILMALFRKLSACADMDCISADGIASVVLGFRSTLKYLSTMGDVLRILEELINKNSIVFSINNLNTILIGLRYFSDSEKHVGSFLSVVFRQLRSNQEPEGEILDRNVFSILRALAAKTCDAPYFRQLVVRINEMLLDIKYSIREPKFVEHMLFGTKSMNTNLPEVNSLLCTIVEILSVNPPTDPTLILRCISYFSHLTSENEILRSKVLPALTKHLLASNVEVRTEQLLEAFSGFKGMSGHCPEVLSLVRAMCSLPRKPFSEHTRSWLPVGAALGLRRMSCCYAEVREVISVLAKAYEESAGTIKVAHTCPMLWGLKGMTAESNEVKRLLTEVTRRTLACTEVYDVKSLVMTLQGIRLMKNDCDAVNELISAIAIKLRESREPFTGQAVAMSLCGLQAMKMNTPALRELLSALSVRIADCKSRMTPQELGMAFLGFRSIPPESEEARSLLSIVLSKAVASHLESLDSQGIAMILTGLGSMSGSPEALRVIEWLTPLIPKSGPFDPLGLTSSLNAVQHLYLDCPEILRLISALASAVSACTSEFGHDDIVRGLEVLKAINVEHIECQQLVSALAQKISDSRAALPVGHLESCFAFLAPLSNDYHVVHDLLASLTNKLRQVSKMTNSNLSSVLRNLYNFTKAEKEVNDLISVLAEMAPQATGPCDANMIWGISGLRFLWDARFLSSDVSILLTALIPRIEAVPDPVSANALSSALSVVGAIRGSDMIALKLLSVLLNKVEKGDEVWSVRYLCRASASFALAEQNQEHFRVLGEKLSTCTDPFDSAAVSKIAVNLRRHNSDHPNIAEFLRVLTKIIIGNPQNRYNAQQISSCLGGIRRMEATPEVLAFLKSLTPKIIECDDNFATEFAARSLFGFTKLRSTPEVVNALQALAPKIFRQKSFPRYLALICQNSISNIVTKDENVMKLRSFLSDKSVDSN